MSISEQVNTLRKLAEERVNSRLVYDAMLQAADTIESLSAKLQAVNMERSAEDYGGWIPCKERLPENDGVYLATIDGEIAGEDKPFSGLAEFENGKWIDDEDDYQFILAWKPLPEPYHEP